jgi:lysophospholipase-3
MSSSKSSESSKKLDDLDYSDTASLTDAHHVTPQFLFWPHVKGLTRKHHAMFWTGVVVVFCVGTTIGAAGVTVWDNTQPTDTQQATTGANAMRHHSVKSSSIDSDSGYCLWCDHAPPRKFSWFFGKCSPSPELDALLSRPLAPLLTPILQPSLYFSLHPPGYGKCKCHDGWQGACCDKEINPKPELQDGVIFGDLQWPWNSPEKLIPDWLPDFKAEVNVPKPHIEVDANSLSPVIVIGGLASGEIEARLTDAPSDHWLCPTTSGWYKIWVNVAQMIPFVTLECTMERLVPVLADDGVTWGNAPGIETRTSTGWGTTRSTIGVGPLYYFSSLLGALEEYGYESGVNLHTAPYDWRFAPGAGQDEWLVDMKKLVEETVARNGGRPAHLVGHSMGCLMALDFLNDQTDDWLELNVGKFVAQGCPWGGSANFVQSSASGYALGVPLLPPSILRPVQAAAPCGVWMYPSSDLWDDDEVIAKTPSKEYTVANLDDMLTDLHLADSLTAWNQVKARSALWNGDFRRGPRVDTYAMIGVGLDSDEAFEYSKDFGAEVADPPKSISKSKGDGLVSLRSLTRFKAWSESHDELGVKLKWQEFPCAEHISMVHNQDVVDLTLAILLGDGCGGDDQGECGLYRDGWDVHDCVLEL